MNVTVWDQDSLRAEVLGPVRAWRGERELPLGGPRQRTVFAVLAVRAGQVVSHAELIDALWGQDPPASAVSSIYTYVTGLRRALDPDRPRRSPGQVLVSAGSGYLLRLDGGELDAEVFYAHRARAQRQRAARDLRGAAQSFDAALPGSRFSPDGTLRHWLRVPFTAPPGTLDRAVALLREAHGAPAGPAGR